MQEKEKEKAFLLQNTFLISEDLMQVDTRSGLTAEERERDVEVAITLIPIAFFIFAAVIAVSACTGHKGKLEDEDTAKEKKKKAQLKSSDYGTCRIIIERQGTPHSNYDKLKIKEKESLKGKAPDIMVQNFSAKPFNLHPVY